jgi:hypothetical protein
VGQSGLQGESRIRRRGKFAPDEQAVFEAPLSTPGAILDALPAREVGAVTLRSRTLWARSISSILVVFEAAGFRTSSSSANGMILKNARDPVQERVQIPVGPPSAAVP